MTRIVRAATAGIVSLIAAPAGTRVRREQPVILLEVMKMEITAEAPADGVVRDILVQPGDAVEENQPLFSLDV